MDNPLLKLCHRFSIRIHGYSRVPKVLGKIWEVDGAFPKVLCEPKRYPAEHTPRSPSGVWLRRSPDHFQGLRDGRPELAPEGFATLHLEAGPHRIASQPLLSGAKVLSREKMKTN